MRMNQSLHAANHAAVNVDGHRPSDPVSMGPRERGLALDAARQILAPKKTSSPAYPMSALGPLADVCEFMAKEGQVDMAMAGQTVLATASLLTQGLFRVRTLAGDKPLSLFLMTLAASGDGKSHAESVALGPVREWQEREVTKHRETEIERRRARPADRSAGVHTAPCPYRVTRDATPEALRDDLDAGLCSQGVFTAEAAAIVSGYSMRPEQRAKSAALFNLLWDDGLLSTSRVTAGRIERPGVRLAMHWLIQPTLAAEVLADITLTEGGFWPRFLLACPPPLAPRRARMFEPECSSSVQTYWARCNELLDRTLPQNANTCPSLRMTPSAQRRFETLFEEYENAARLGALRSIKPVALRATEQACRIAGVLAAFRGGDDISETDAVNGAHLARYSIDCWKSLAECSEGPSVVPNALQLYGWLLEQDDAEAEISDILRLGPPKLRTKQSRDECMQVLTSAGLAARSGNRITTMTP